MLRKGDIDEEMCWGRELFRKECVEEERCCGGKVLRKRGVDEVWCRGRKLLRKEEVEAGRCWGGKVLIKGGVEEREVLRKEGVEEGRCWGRKVFRNRKVLIYHHNLEINWNVNQLTNCSPFIALQAEWINKRTILPRSFQVFCLENYPNLQVSMQLFSDSNFLTAADNLLFVTRLIDFHVSIDRHRHMAGQGEVISQPDILKGLVKSDIPERILHIEPKWNCSS